MINKYGPLQVILAMQLQHNQRIEEGFQMPGVIGVFRLDDTRS